MKHNNLRQYRTNRGTRLACILFRHIALKILALRQQSFRFFVQSDEKSNYAIRTPPLCGIALKHTLRILFAWLLVILCAGGIFYLSSQNGFDSAALSAEAMGPIGRFLVTLFGEAAHNVFRKFAHFFEYAVLMFLTYRALYRTRRSLSAVLPFILCVLYAVSDEIHQYFVPERACRIFDVGVDTLGCIVGGLCFYFLIRLTDFFRHRKRGQQS